ncbi:MAG: hypothetical protein R3C30_01400 [Hyphomonadaceae bacterium]
MGADNEQPEPQEPLLSRSEKIFIRISVWQTVLSVVGVFIAVVALYAALTESEAVRRQTAAAVWPYVQLAVSDYVGEDDAVFEFSFTNAGVGPAHVRAMRVTMAGEHMTTWADVVRTASGGREVEFSQTAANNRVLRAGERIVIFGTRDTSLVEALRLVASDPANAIEYCYCSIFDECWLANSRTPEALPTPVAHCPDYRDASFRS